MQPDSSLKHVDRRRILKTGAAALATGLGVSVASGSAVADESDKNRSQDESESSEPCFPVELDIEVKPGNGDQTDPINPNGGTIPVAVHRTEEFDPTQRKVDYRFDAAGEVGCDSAEPVHGGHVEDGDLVLHFAAAETNFERGDERAELLWVEAEGDEDETANGECACRGLSGVDDVKVVGK